MAAGVGAARPPRAPRLEVPVITRWAGMYNLYTAQARSINAQTSMKYNNYVAAATQSSARMTAAKINQEFARNQSLYDAHQQQLRDNPGQHAIENGDALNLAVSDLSDPRLGQRGPSGCQCAGPGEPGRRGPVPGRGGSDQFHAR